MGQTAEIGAEYSGFIGKILGPKTSGGPLAVDLLAGCGGLALGFEAQGFFDP